MLSLKKVSKTYRHPNRTIVVADAVCLDLTEEKITALVGPSGSGKSTTGKMLLGLEQPDSGTVCLDDIPIADMDRSRKKRYRREVQMVPQHPDAAFNPKLTVGASLREVFRFHTVCPLKNQQDYLSSTLHHVKLHHQLLSRYPSQLSGGELQRLAIARAILTKPRYLILDEVTSMLDVSVQATIVKTLRDIRKKHLMGYLFITHNLRLANAFCDTIIQIKNGKISRYKSQL